MSDKIISYFERLGRTVKSLSIDHIINRTCRHCGYGKTYSGNVTVSDSGDTNHYYPPNYSDDNNSDDNNSDDNSSDDNSSDDYDVVTEGPERTIPFVYWSGCLSYEETMTFDDNQY